MKICFQVFDRDAFRKRYNIDDRRKPISKAVYDTLSVNIAWRSQHEQDELVRKKEKFKQYFVNFWQEKISI